MGKLTLFREVQSCQDCLFSWEGYAHGFSRGHTVMEKGERVVFAPDDLGYLVPRGEHIEIESQLTGLGWHQLESCPRCGSRRLFPLEYSANSQVDVECDEVTGEDLEKRGRYWRLNQNAVKRFT